MAIKLIFEINYYKNDKTNSSENKIIEFDMTKSELTFGRSSKCDIQIDDSLLSSFHGKFTLNEAGDLLYVDANSTNGSFYLNQRIENLKIKKSDELKVGNTQIRFVLNNDNNKKNAVKLNQALKSKVTNDHGWNKSNLLEQEKTSGKTSFLQLEKVKKKKY